MLDTLLCNENVSLMEVLKAINTNGLGTVFVVDDNRLLKGVLTDGDIRRLLLREVGLDKRAGDYLNPGFVFARDNEEITSILEKTSEKIRIIPIVDDKDRVVDFAQYNKRIHLPVAAPNLRGNEFKYLFDAFLSTWISSTGAYINRFEKEFSAYCGVEHGVAVSNGTVALHLAMVTLGMGPGDEVIIPDFTFAATINTVIHAGATPVIVDIDPESWCISPAEIEKAITPKTRAIIPVHIYGQPCDMDAIMAIAKKHKLFVIEDCAEAHGATYKGKRVGSFGDISCFSFFGNKVITTGEGGMCITNSAALDEKMRVLRDHGMSKTKRYWHEAVGYNYRMTNLQAAIGVAQLERIDEILKHKTEIENSYREKLGDIPFLHFQRHDIADTERITWLVCATLSTGNRDTWLDSFKEKGIDVRPFFYPLSEMEIYKPYVFSNETCRKIAATGMNLPSVDILNDKNAELMRSILLHA